MKTEHIIIIVVAVIAIAGVAWYFYKKKQSKANSVTISISSNPTQNRSAPTINVEPRPSVEKELEAVKSETADSITDRHTEAAKIIRESVANIAGSNTDDTVRKTKNEAKLEQMREDLNNLE